MDSPVPFKIAVSEEKIQRLRQKLSLADYPNEVADTNDPWSRGAPLSDIKRLAQYWGNGFDWRKEEAALNRFPQFTVQVEIDGFDTLKVHFIYQPSTVTNAIPLLFLHGWPGSFVEVTKILPELVQGRKNFPAFSIIAPSLIDFGFSSASSKIGFDMERHAEVYHKLMLNLGYDEYVVQGGDLGHLIARFMAKKYGDKHCKACHINQAVPAEPTATAHPELYVKKIATPLSEVEKAGLGRMQHFSKEGDGYYKEQSTKPQTIGYSLNDSPIGLLAWIYEKLHDWSDGYAWTDDEILTWVSIYYFSEAGPAATSRIYYEVEHSNPGAFLAAQAYVDVPLGIARFSKDLVLLPKLWNQTLGPIVYQSDYDNGGHFAAYERPDAIVHDLRAMFGKDGGAYGCVSGRYGYSG